MPGAQKLGELAQRYAEPAAQTLRVANPIIQAQVDPFEGIPEEQKKALIEAYSASAPTFGPAQTDQIRLEDLASTYTGPVLSDATLQGLNGTYEDVDATGRVIDPLTGLPIEEEEAAEGFKRGGAVKGYQKGGEVRADGPDKAGFEGALADYYASLRGMSPQPAVIEDLAAKYRVGTPTNIDTILDYYRANNGALNPGVRMLPAETSVSASPEADYYPGLARALAEGAFYGFNDEIEGAVRAAPALLTGGFGDAYGDEVSRIREQQALFMEQNPEEYLGAVMGGAMLPAVVPGGQALTAARLASLASRAPGAGRITNLAVRGASPSSRSFVGRELPEIATGSVLYGAGVAPSIEDIPQSVVDELGMSLGVYGAQSAAGAAGRAAGRPVKRTYSKLRNQVRGGR